MRWLEPLRTSLGLAATVTVVLGFLLATASPAAAHAQLISTDPTEGALLQKAPDQVTLTFNEPVRLTAQEITVYDADGQTLSSEAVSSGTEVTIDLPDAEELGRGTFVVGWFVLSGDGHPISGSLTFSVGERSDEVAEPPPPPTSSAAVTAVQGIVGGLLYLGLLVAAGLACFVALVLPTSYDGDRVRRQVRRLTRLAAGLGALAALLSIPIASVYARGAELSDVLSGFDAALVFDELVSAAMLVVGLVVVAATIRARPPTRRDRFVLLGGAALALAAPAVVGHTRSYQPVPLLIASDIVHVTAGAVWLGGLVGLVLALRALAGREELAATTLARFSTLAGGLLLAVAAAGTVLAWRILGSWSGFVDTGYGVLLLVKIGLALVVAGLGAWNRFRLLPQVRAAAGFAERERAADMVVRAVRVEAVVLVVVLAVTGFLVNRSPRPAPVEVPPGRTGVQDARLADVEVFAVMSPRRAGPNTILVQLQDEAGEPVIPPRPPELELRSGTIDLGTVPLENTDTGTYRAYVLIPQGGTWEAQVSLRLTRFESPVTTLRFQVAD